MIQGLGVMGYPMAVNLRKGLDHETILLICDINRDACDKLREDLDAKYHVRAVVNGAEAARLAVSGSKARSFASN